MPLNKKGKKIMKAMKKQYGAEEGEAVFYASKNKGVIDDVERKALGGSVKSKKEKLAAIAEPFDEVTQRDVITARKEKLKFRDGGPTTSERFRSKAPARDYDAEAREMAEFSAKYAANLAATEKLLDELPRSMKQKTRLGPFRSQVSLKENRKPKTKEERAGGKNPTDEEAFEARLQDRKRKKFEKKVQEKMGSFESGGVVKAAILIMDSGPQPEKAQVKGTKFSGTF